MTTIFRNRTIRPVTNRFFGRMLFLAILVNAITIMFLAFPLAAGAEINSDPMPEIPPGAHLEGDILKWDDRVYPQGAPSTNLWPNGVVPYLFFVNMDATMQNQAIAAMALWENVADVHFQPMSNPDSDYLLIQNANRNSSFIGPQGAGMQLVNIVSWNSQFIIAHELGHALGLWHEQSRLDRDTYVVINTDNIASTCGISEDEPCDNNYYKEPADLYTPYDFDSVMHYWPDEFSIGGDIITVRAAYNYESIAYAGLPIGPGGQCYTNNPPAGGWQKGIGQRTHLSHWDCRIMSFMYPESDWRFVSWFRAPLQPVQLGFFNYPWETVDQAIVGTPDHGTLWIDDGIYDVQTSTISKPMVLKAPLGAVVLK